ncbi:MAG: carboxymuconolactone decarboxylase family protein [Chitinophagales bacterium]|nr:carboxymuconolactone decarboxylase family protein [Bacteroidota bacterium]
MSRLIYHEVAPDAIKGLLNIETYTRNSTLEHSLLELVKMRVSQINNCAYCLDMHSKDARKGGESEMRLYTLSAWRETPFFTDKERAALEWAEALTLIAQQHISDQLYETMLQHFSEKELVDLTMAIVSINGWNRLAIPFQSEPGHYQAK